jgi:hypothetical protein
MAEPIAIKQIRIGEDNHEINSRYWGDHESSEFNLLASKVDEKLDKQIFEDNITIDETGEFVIADNNNNIGLKLDETGLQVKDVTSIKDGEKHVLSEKADRDYVDKKFFYGTWDEYNRAEIEPGTFVIIVDENDLGGDSGGSGSGDNSGIETTAKLGTAVLGKMILGQN